MSGKDWSKVSALLEEQMPKAGYDEASVDGALQLWADFLETAPRWRKPGIYAAGVEYCIIQMSYSRRTQKEVAQAYGVSVSSVASAYHTIWDDLSLSRFNQKYVSEPSAEANPFEQLKTLLMSGVFGFKPPEPIQWRNEQRRVLNALPQKQWVWSLLVLPSPVLIEEEPDRVFHMALLHDDGGNEVMESLLIDLEQMTLDDFRSKFVVQCQQRGGRPARLVCTHEDVVDVLISAMLKVDVKVSFEPEHEANVVRQFRLLNEADQVSLVRDPGGQVFEHFGEFLKQGQRMLELEPWMTFTPNEALIMEHSTLSGCAVFMGHDQSVYGASIFESLEDVRQLHIQDPAVFNEPGRFEEVRKQVPRALSVTRFDWGDLNQRTLDDLESVGIKVSHGDSIVLPMVTQGCVSHADIAYLIQVLTALGEALEDRYLESDGDYYVRVGRKSVKVYGELIMVVQRDESFDVHAAIAPFEEQKYQHYESQLLLRFDESDEAADFRARGFEPYLLDICLEMGFSYLGVLVPRMDHHTFKKLCFEILPRKLTIDFVDGRLFQEELLAFWSFLDKTFGVKKPKIMKVLKSPSFVVRFEAAMNDEQNWGMAKTFAMGGTPSMSTMPVIAESGQTKKKASKQKKKKRKQAKTSRSKNRKKKK